MGFQFNTKHWPVIYFKACDEINDENFEEYKVNYLNLLIKSKKNKDKVFLIADLNTEIQIPMKYIFKLAAFNKKLYKFNKLYLKVVCIFSQSKSFKNLLKLYLSLITPSSPYKLCSSFDKINVYLKDSLDTYFDTNIFNLNKENCINNNNENENHNEDENDNNNINKLNLYKKLNEEEINEDEINKEEINDLKN